MKPYDDLTKNMNSDNLISKKVIKGQSIDN